MVWTLYELRRSPGIKETEERLFELMRAAGKARFGVARDDDSYNQPCVQGYGIALELDHPHCGIIYLHELLHGVLLEELYPTAWSSERPEPDETTRTILWNFTNTIHHVEIFDRMRRCGADLDHYFAHRAGDTMRKVERIVAEDDWTFARRNMDCLVLFDTFLMGPHGEAVQAAYRRHATRSLEACAEIVNEVRRIGCATPEAALASARVFQRVMARYCRDYGAPERFARFWDSLKYLALRDRDDLQDCPAWVKPPLRLEVIEGDLLDQDVEVIVNAWNRNIIPWWLLLPQGVSGAIKRRGGKAPFKELRSHGSIPLGGAVLTSAGRLPFKGIIHVAGINILWRASERSIRDSVKNAVRLANESGFKSIAFPLIGAGSGGFNQEKAKALMLDELRRIDVPMMVKVVVFKRAR